MIFPKTRWQILHNYQVELESWVEGASLDNIKQFFAMTHGLVYPNDWNELVNSHIGKLDYIQSCTHCQEILPAILTVSQINRPELSRLFKIK